MRPRPLPPHHIGSPPDLLTGPERAAFAGTLLTIFGLMAAVALWLRSVEARDARLEAVAACADSAVSAEHRGDAVWHAAWDRCWPTSGAALPEPLGAEGSQP